MRKIELIIVLSAACVSYVHGGWIDPDTPESKRTSTSLVDGTTYHLVMSDEFNVPNRTFKDGDDPMWTSMDKADNDKSSQGGGSLQFYNSSAVTTEDGFLKIRTFVDKTEWEAYDPIKNEYVKQTTNFTSGMLQSWNKFCFTGGIIEVDVIFPGDPSVGGLWPAVWLLGNLGRATYERSTNRLWPWSYDKCNRTYQDPQDISACNSINHFGMKPFQGRGATEIDVVEVMTGDSAGPLPSTVPPIALPYGAMTLQLAPGVPENRPQSGGQPQRENVLSANGHTEYLAQVWYDGLEMHGNTSINPFFYGTYLAKTKPDEPVHRTEKQAYQADAIGAIHQLTQLHFQKPHTFRLEWQPGPGGRLDWFVKSYEKQTPNGTGWYEGDGDGSDWSPVYTIFDESLSSLMESQIPIEPSSLVINTAISSTWGFPYDAPSWCPKCYDCHDPSCTCSFYPGFCRMLESGSVAMYIDSIRVYQSFDASAHVGANHSLGCDPPEFPTRQWIHGHEERYMRDPPFSLTDKKPLKPIQHGGGACDTSKDCGGYHGRDGNKSGVSKSIKRDRGSCVVEQKKGFMSVTSKRVCSCNEGFTGPHCLAIAHVDEAPSAFALHMRASPFHVIANVEMPFFLVFAVVMMATFLLSLVVARVLRENQSKAVDTVKYTPLKASDTKAKASGSGPSLPFKGISV